MEPQKPESPIEPGLQSESPKPKVKFPESQKSKSQKSELTDNNKFFFILATATIICLSIIGIVVFILAMVSMANNNTPEVRSEVYSSVELKSMEMGYQFHDEVDKEAIIDACMKNEPLTVGIKENTTNPTVTKVTVSCNIDKESKMTIITVLPSEN